MTRWLLVLFLLVWTQADASTVQCWNIWYKEKLSDQWTKIGTVSTNQYDMKVPGYYTVSASNSNGETWAIK